MKKNDNYINFLSVGFAEAIGLGICCVFSAYPVFSVLSMICVAFWFVFLWFVYRGLYIKYFSVVFGVIATIMGIAIVEFDRLFMINLQQWTAFKGSLPLLVFCNWLFTFSLIIFEKDIAWTRSVRKPERQNIPKRKKSTIKYFTILSLCINLFLFVRVIRYPAFVMHIDRFTYERMVNYRSGIGRLLVALSNYLIIVNLAAIKHGYRRLGLAATVTYLLFSFWVGNKFGTFFSIFYIVLLFFYDQINYLIKKYVRYVFITGVAMVILVLIAVNIQTNISSGFGKGEYLKWRLACEGELWWRTYDLFHCKAHISEFSNELIAVFNGKDSIAMNVGSNNGIYKMMYLCAPKERVDRVIASGSRYCAAAFPAMNYYFGVIGPIIFSIIMGYFFSRLINGLLSDIREERYLRAIILTRLLAVLREVFDQFVFYQLVEMATILSIIFLIITVYRKFRIVSCRRTLMNI